MNYKCNYDRADMEFYMAVNTFLEVHDTDEMVPIEDSLTYMWQYGLINDDARKAIKMFFCDIWQPYAPRLCQWIKDNKFDGDEDVDVCCTLFADEMHRANSLYKLEAYKKEIQDVRNNFFA